MNYPLAGFDGIGGYQQSYGAQSQMNNVAQQYGLDLQRQAAMQNAAYRRIRHSSSFGPYSMNPRYVAELRIGTDEPKPEPIILSPHPYEYGGTVPEADRPMPASKAFSWLLTALMIIGLVWLATEVWSHLAATAAASTLPVERP